MKKKYITGIVVTLFAMAIPMLVACSSNRVEENNNYFDLSKDGELIVNANRVNEFELQTNTGEIVVHLTNEQDKAAFEIYDLEDDTNVLGSFTLNSDTLSKSFGNLNNNSRYFIKSDQNDSSMLVKLTN